MKDIVYYDVNGTRRFPRTLLEAFPQSDNTNPFCKPSQWEINFDNVFTYIAIFISGFLFGLVYAYR